MTVTDYHAAYRESLIELDHLRQVEAKARELASRVLSFEQVCFTNDFRMPEPLGDSARELLQLLEGDNETH